MTMIAWCNVCEEWYILAREISEVCALSAYPLCVCCIKCKGEICDDIVSFVHDSYYGHNSMIFSDILYSRWYKAYFE